MLAVRYRLVAVAIFNLLVVEVILYFLGIESTRSQRVIFIHIVWIQWMHPTLGVIVAATQKCLRVLSTRKFFGIEALVRLIVA